MIVEGERRNAMDKNPVLAKLVSAGIPVVVAKEAIEDLPKDPSVWDVTRAVSMASQATRYTEERVNRLAIMAKICARRTQMSTKIMENVQ